MAISLNRLLISALPIALFGCGLAGDADVAPQSSGTQPADDNTVDQASDDSVRETDAQAVAQSESLDDIGAVDTDPDPKDAQYYEKADYLSFVYQWPETLSQYGVLKSYFTEDADAKLSEIREFMAGDDRLTDPDEEFKPQYASDTAWSVHGTSGPLISLSADFYNYTGGAHGIYGAVGLLYDVAAARTVDPIDLFANKAAARASIQDKYCALLDRERSVRRGGEEPRRDDLLWECIDPLEQTLIFHAGDKGEKFDRLIVYAGPYSAGPYAESDYTIELPVSAELRAAIRPEYRAAFEVNTEAPIVAGVEE